MSDQSDKSHCPRVSLLTALRIWVSLPDELGSESSQQPQSELRARRTSLLSPCNCSNQAGLAASRTQYQQEELEGEVEGEVEDSEDFLLLPGALESQQSQLQTLCPPSYTDCLTV